jgi:hypothetical protein
MKSFGQGMTTFITFSKDLSYIVLGIEKVEVGYLRTLGIRSINLDEGWRSVYNTWVLLSFHVGLQLLWYEYQSILSGISLKIS